MKKGVTFIELLIVIAIFLTVSGVGMLGISKYYDYYHFSKEINELVDDLHYAKQMSITEQVNYAVRFDYENNGYEVLRYGQEEEQVKRKNFSSGVEVIDIDSYLEARFTLFGAVSENGKIKLVRDLDKRIINVKPSGFIYVERTNDN